MFQKQQNLSERKRKIKNRFLIRETKSNKQEKKKAEKVNKLKIK